MGLVNSKMLSDLMQNDDAGGAGRLLLHFDAYILLRIVLKNKNKN